jgi:hypothetical protein
MTDHVLGDLTLRTTESGDFILVTWLGRSNAATPGDTIVPVLLAAADRAVETKLRLVFAFEQLEFFNSATITVLLRTIRALRGKQLELTLRYDETKRWQRMFFDAFTGVGLSESDNVRLEALRP